MNAAAQRRLTPVFAGTVAVFGLLWFALIFGAGRGVQWDPPRVTPPLPAVHNVALPTPPALQSFAQVWEHPLFSNDRKPIVSSGGDSGGVSLGDLQLTGVILTPTLRMALLGPAQSNNNKGDDSQEVRVKEGANVPDTSWKLIKVLPRSAVFASPSGRTELKLPAGAPIDQPASNTAPPGAISMTGPAGAPPPPGMQVQNHAVPPSPPGGPMPPNEAQAQRLQKLRAAILKQRAEQAGNAQGEH
jgi:general secretion pathway protein N